MTKKLILVGVVAGVVTAVAVVAWRKRPQLRLFIEDLTEYWTEGQGSLDLQQPK